MEKKKQKTVLVVGGSGPTGPYLIDALLDRDLKVSMLHTGTHKPDRGWYSNGQVEVLLSNPFKEETFKEAVRGREWEYAFVMYGRLRMIVQVLRGKVRRLFSVGGLAVYAGFAAPHLVSPTGMLVPQREDSRLSTDSGLSSGVPNHPNVKIHRIIETEAALFQHFPNATHFRYPWIYGEDSLSLWDYIIVKRIVDGRKKIILPDNGLSLISRGYSRNVAHALISAFDNEKVSEGEVYNVGDEQALTLRQIVEIIAQALGKTVSIVNIPSEFAVPCRPLLRKPSTHHEVIDVSKSIYQLGYRDVVPAEIAVANVARWLSANMPDHKTAVNVLHDPFDYDAEDALIDAYIKGDWQAMKDIKWKHEPGYSIMGYSPEVNPFDKLTQDERHSGEYDPVKKKRSKL